VKLAQKMNFLGYFNLTMQFQQKLVLSEALGASFSAGISLRVISGKSRA
jgi:hypothetical protein